MRWLYLPPTPRVEGDLLNYIRNEIQKAEVKLLIVGDQMPADHDRLLERVPRGSFLWQRDQLLDK